MTRQFCFALFVVVGPVLALAEESAPEILKLPEGAAWASFDVVVTHESFPDGELRRLIKVRVSEPEQVRGEACRWVRFDVTRSDGSEPQHLRLLMAEKHLIPRIDPFGNLLEVLVDRKGEGNWQAEDVSAIHNLINRQPHIKTLFPLASLENVEALEKKSIAFQQGNLECDGHRALHTAVLAPENPQKPTVEITYELWEHESAPFGLVEANLRVRIIVNDKEATAGKIDVYPVNFGTGDGDS